MKSIKNNKYIVLILLSILVSNTACKKETYSIPTLTTYEATDITPTSAISGSVITDYGGTDITAKGVCWSTSEEPTIKDFSTNEGKGNEHFTSKITGLVKNTKYYIRAYATNSQGTGYGPEIIIIARYEFPGETVEVSGGTFNMGNNDGDNHEKPVHSVSLHDFYISKYEVTNKQYALFLNKIGANADGIVDGVEYLDADSNGVQIHYQFAKGFMVDTGKKDYPAVELTWYGANAYCEYYGGRLPTEAEWEFVARGGKISNGYTYSGSNKLDDVGWYIENSTNPDNDMEDGKGTHIVGLKAANELGVYDMSGNVYEWCSDFYGEDYYSDSPTYNPTGPSSGTWYVLRGGAWIFEAHDARVSHRSWAVPYITGTIVGFRPVFDN